MSADLVARRFQFDLCREEGDGALLSIDVHGRLLPHELDLLLAAIDHDPEEFGLAYDDQAGRCVGPYRGFDVEVMVRRSVHPLECEDPDGQDCGCDWQEWVYDPVGSAGAVVGDGEKLVTRLAVDSTWRHRCYRHRNEVAQVGLPQSDFADPGPDEDQAPFIDGYLYVCRDCARDIDTRVTGQHKLWVAEADRRRRTGVPDHLLYA